MNILGFEDLLKLAVRSPTGIAVKSEDRGRLRSLLHEVRQRLADPKYVDLVIAFSATEHDTLLVFPKAAGGGDLSEGPPQGDTPGP